MKAETTIAPELLINELGAYRHLPRHLRGRYRYMLFESCRFQTGITGEKAEVRRWCYLTPDGVIWIAGRYLWDGPSGPAIDTSSFIRGSLVHDALYQLIREGRLARHYRRDADQLLRRLCREDGMSRIRSWWVYRAVRLFGWRAVRPGAPEVAEREETGLLTDTHGPVAGEERCPDYCDLDVQELGCLPPSPTDLTYLLKVEAKLTAVRAAARRLGILREDAMAETRTRPLIRFINSQRLKVQIQWEPRDLWVGMFWELRLVPVPEESVQMKILHAYLCVIPMFPIHVTWLVDLLCFYPEARDG